MYKIKKQKVGYRLLIGYKGQVLHQYHYKKRLEAIEALLIIGLELNTEDKLIIRGF